MLPGTCYQVHTAHILHITTNKGRLCGSMAFIYNTKEHKVPKLTMFCAMKICIHVGPTMIND